MKDSPIVYLLQEPTTQRDLSSAEKYGKIVSIIGSNEKPSINIPSALSKITNAMTKYRPEFDVIVFAGSDPIVEFLLGVVAERLQLKELTKLIWNRSRDPEGRLNGGGFYVPKKIQLQAVKKPQEDFSHEY